MLNSLVEVLKSSEDFLLHRLFIHIAGLSYRCCTDTDKERWEKILKEQTQKLIQYLEKDGQSGFVGMGGNPVRRIGAESDIPDAEKCRKRDAFIDGDLRVAKQLRPIFVELVRRVSLSAEAIEHALTVTHRFFDEFEASFYDEWLEQRETQGKSEKIFRAILENLHDLYYRTDLAGRLVMVSPSAVEVLGYEGIEEIIGRSVKSFCVHPEEFDKAMKAIEKEGQVNDYWIRIKKKDDTPFDISLSGYFYFGENREVLGVEGIIRDVTQRKRMEEALLEAKHAAELANRAKSDFLATMSHEIRTPMNGIIGTLDLLLEREQDAWKREYLQMAGTAAYVLLDIINSVLDFSKIEAGKMRSERNVFSLRETVKRALEIMECKAKEKNLKIVSPRIPSDIPDLLIGDSLHLGQVLSNLIDNAVKFTEKGFIRVQIDQIAVDDQFSTLQFMIQDTGMGILPDKIGVVFDPFMQEEASVTRRYGGTGLGLSIAKQLVELMGGRIWVDSRPGRGSKFFFTAAFGIQKNMDALPKKVKVGDLLLEQNEAAGKLCILVAEDNSINQKIISTLLTKAGHRVTIVGNGQEALDAVRSFEYDLILMDLQMPVMDGFETTKQIRGEEQKTGRRIPIIAVTAHAFENDRKKCMKIGMDGFLSKPIRSHDLTKAIRQVFRGVSSSQARESKDDTETAYGSSDRLFDIRAVMNCSSREDRDAEDMLEALIGEFPMRLDELDKVWGSHDGNAVDEKAKILREMAKSMGASRMVGYILRVQMAARKGDMTGCGGWIEKVREEFEIFRDAVSCCDWKTLMKSRDMKGDFAAK